MNRPFDCQMRCELEEAQGGKNRSPVRAGPAYGMGRVAEAGSRSPAQCKPVFDLFWKKLAGWGAEALLGAESAVAGDCRLGHVSLVVGNGEQRPCSVQTLHSGKAGERMGE